MFARTLQMHRLNHKTVTRRGSSHNHLRQGICIFKKMLLKYKVQVKLTKASDLFVRTTWSFFVVGLFIKVEQTGRVRHNLTLCVLYTMQTTWLHIIRNSPTPTSETSPHQHNLIISSLLSCSISSFHSRDLNRMLSSNLRNLKHPHMHNERPVGREPVQHRHILEALDWAPCVYDTTEVCGMSTNV